jgi:hypothetical protein
MLATMAINNPAVVACCCHAHRVIAGFYFLKTAVQ